MLVNAQQGIVDQPLWKSPRYLKCGDADSTLTLQTLLSALRLGVRLFQPKASAYFCKVSNTTFG